MWEEEKVGMVDPVGSILGEMGRVCMYLPTFWLDSHPRTLSFEAAPFGSLEWSAVIPWNPPGE